MNTDNQKEEKGKSYLLLLVLLVAMAGAAAYFYHSDSQKQVVVERVTEENAELKRELDSISSQFEQTKTKHSTDSVRFTEKEAELQATIDKLRADLKKSKANKSDLDKLKREIAALKEEIEKYKKQVAELQAKNEVLNQQNEVLRTDSVKAVKKIDSLSLENADMARKIEAAKVLKTSSLDAKPQRRKGNGQYIYTDKSRRVHRLLINFAIAENELVPDQNVVVYVQVLNSKGEVVAPVKDGDNVQIDGKPLVYTTATSVNYAKDSKVFSVEFENKQWTAGKYTVKLFTKTRPFGVTEFSLR